MPVEEAVAKEKQAKQIGDELGEVMWSIRPLVASGFGVADGAPGSKLDNGLFDFVLETMEELLRDCSCEFCNCSFDILVGRRTILLLPGCVGRCLRTLTSRKPSHLQNDDSPPQIYHVGKFLLVLIQFG